jgi:hypothetical protein
VEAQALAEGRSLLAAAQVEEPAVPVAVQVVELATVQVVELATVQVAGLVVVQAVELAAVAEAVQAAVPR